MSPHAAVCIRCGNLKPAALAGCTSCDFAPSSREDQARSLMLSRQFDAGEEVIGLQQHELQSIASRIQTGQPYQFDPDALAKVMSFHDTARQATPRRLVLDLVRWLWLPAILLAIVYMVLFAGVGQ